MGYQRYCKNFGNPKLSREHTSPLAERLAKRIQNDLGLELDPKTFRRTYAGYWQRTNGAWAWTMGYRNPNNPREVGSCDPATVCVRKDHKLCIAEGGEIVAEPIREIMTEKAKPIILKKVEERENMGYDNLSDSDVHDIFDECRRKHINIFYKDLMKMLETRGNEYENDVIEDAEYTVIEETIGL